MTLTVRIPTPLRRFTDGQEILTCSASNLQELLCQLEERFPPLRPHLRDASGRVRPFLNVFVNEEDIRFLGGNLYQFRDGDEVMLVPSIAGGSPSSPHQVVVPATTANLGCAFDCAALALNLHLKASAVLSNDRHFQISHTGPNADRIPLDDSNLMIRAMRRVARTGGTDLRGAYVEVESEIPVGAGLGSSAAAIVAGILLGERLLRLDLDPATVLRFAAELEGHPDNVAAACYGGLVVTALAEETSGVLVRKIVIPAELEFIAIIPELVVPTEEARALLPEQYSRQDAVHNLQRTALLAASCFSGRFDLFPELFRDRLHQPYRARLVPGLRDCLELRHDGLLGIFLSGAGSSVIGVARHSAREIARALLEEFQRAGVPARASFLKGENCGALDWEKQRLQRHAQHLST